MNRNNYSCGICYQSFRFTHSLRQHYSQCSQRFNDSRKRLQHINQQRQRRNQRVQAYQQKQERSMYQQRIQQLNQNWSRPDRRPTQRSSTMNSRQELLRQKNIQQQYAEQKRMQLLRRKRFEDNNRIYSSTVTTRQQQQLQIKRNSVNSFQERRRAQMEKKQRYEQQQAEFKRHQQRALTTTTTNNQQRQQRLVRQQRYERQLAERKRNNRQQKYQQLREQQLQYEQEQRKRERERMMRERKLLNRYQPQTIHIKEPYPIVPHKSPNPQKAIIPSNVKRYGSGNNTTLYSQLLKGKRLVIVGPSSSLTGKGKGEFIESYDLIVRTNKSFKPISKERAQDIGQRLDILYNSMNITDCPGENNFKSADLYRRGVKYICSPYPPVDPFRKDIIRFSMENQGLLPFHHIDSRQYGRILEFLKSRPYTGTCAILDILKFDIKELHITGIDFYRYGYYKEYQNKKLTQKDLSHMRDNNIHKSEPQIKLLRYTLVGDMRVTMDKVLDWILFGPYRTIIKKISSNTNLFKNNNNEVKELLSTSDSIMVVGSTKAYPLDQITWTPKANTIIKLNLKRGFTDKCDIVFFNGIVERQLKENPSLLPDSVKYIISFKNHKILRPHADKVVIINPNFLQAAHQYLRKIQIRSISSELFALLLLVHCRNKKIYTAGIDLRSNQNRVCNTLEEETLFKFMKRLGMINDNY